MALEGTELNMKNNLTILSMADSNEALDGCSFRLERSNLVALPASATASNFSEGSQFRVTSGLGTGGSSLEM